MWSARVTPGQPQGPSRKRDPNVWGERASMADTQIKRAASLATAWWADRLLAGDKQKFVETLLPLVEADLEKTGYCDLECDYDPKGHLLTAVRAAGLECAGFLFSARNILPAKHSLDVTPVLLQPKEGYGNWTDAIPVPGSAV